MPQTGSRAERIQCEWFRVVRKPGHPAGQYFEDDLTIELQVLRQENAAHATTQFALDTICVRETGNQPLRDIVGGGCMISWCRAQGTQHARRKFFQEVSAAIDRIRQRLQLLLECRLSSRPRRWPQTSRARPLAAPWPAAADRSAARVASVPLFGSGGLQRRAYARNLRSSYGSALTGKVRRQSSTTRIARQSSSL